MNGDGSLNSGLAAVSDLRLWTSWGFGVVACFRVWGFEVLAGSRDCRNLSKKPMLVYRALKVDPTAL